MTSKLNGTKHVTKINSTSKGCGKPQFSTVCFNLKSDVPCLDNVDLFCPIIFLSIQEEASYSTTGILFQVSLEHSWKKVRISKGRQGQHDKDICP